MATGRAAARTKLMRRTGQGSFERPTRSALARTSAAARKANNGSQGG